MPVEFGEFKGHKMIILKRDDNDIYPFQFGKQKAKLILQYLDDIKKFADDDGNVIKEKVINKVQSQLEDGQGTLVMPVSYNIDEYTGFENGLPEYDENGEIKKDLNKNITSGQFGLDGCIRKFVIHEKKLYPHVCFNDVVTYIIPKIKNKQKLFTVVELDFKEWIEKHDVVIE